MFDPTHTRHAPDPQACLTPPAPYPAPRAPHGTPQSCLLAAAGAGDLEALGSALSEPAARLDLDHPLRLAAKHRHRDAVRLLLARGASLSRAFSAGHTPWRPGKRAQLIEFLASCGIDASFLGLEARPRGPRRKRVSRGPTGAGGPKTDTSRALAAAARRQAWTRRCETRCLHRVLRKHAGLLDEILAGAPMHAELERTVRAALAERGIRDPKRRIAKALVRRIAGERPSGPPAA